MRPSKHATHSRSVAQEIFEISIARLRAKKADLPLVATAERDAITLFAWNEAGGKWTDARIDHSPIERVRGVPSISNTWNWSRRIGLASAKLIYVVCKRVFRSQEGKTEAPASLWVESFRIEDDGSLRQVQRTPVGMPSFIRQITIRGRPTFHTVFARPGFELWAGVDTKRQKLLVVTQTLGENATAEGDGAELTLLTCNLDRLDDARAWEWKKLGAGGYGLDVRQADDALFLVYRQTAHSLRVPLPYGQSIPVIDGSPQVSVDGERASDSFFSPLQLLRVNLETSSVTKLELPGGEHPRIQNIEPLLIVSDRPQLRIRFGVVPRPEVGVQLQINWEIRGMQKLACLLDDQDRIARGILMDLPSSDRLPRHAAPWMNVQDLFTEPAREGIGWASTWGRFPLEPQLFNRLSEKQFFFDFLHKTPTLTLNRSRIILSPNFDLGGLTVGNLRSLVYDVNHAQIGPPAELVPDVTGENAQFAPFERLFQNSGNVLPAPGYSCDNTIGGALISDRDGVPYQFLAYTDLGDGGLRVIYDADLGPPDEPPPIKKPKTLEPESVPGPGSSDERWIDLPAADWQDAGVPAIVLDSDARVLLPPTVNSTLHAQLESLLQSGVTLANLRIDFEEGTSVAHWSEDEVNGIQTELNRLASGSATVSAADGLAPLAFILISPAVITADAETRWEAGIVGEQIAAVSWRFTPPPISPTFPDQSTVVTTATGNPVSVALFMRGDWTVRAEITLANGLMRICEIVVAVAPSLFQLVAAMHRGLSEGDEDPTLNTLGNYRVGTATFNLLQYEVRFPVAAEDLRSREIVIKQLDKTDAQWRFRSNGIGQGLIDYRLRIGFETEDVRLEGLLSTLLKIERIQASFFYGRGFTPGILMNDTRSAALVTRAAASADTLRNGRIGLASALTARPSTDAEITVETRPKVEVSMLPQAIAASVVTLLVGLGAATAAATLVFLLGALGVATAVAAGPGVGIAAAGFVVAAAVAVFLFIAFVVPPRVGDFIATNIERRLTAQGNRDSLADSRLLQFAGEGVAEAIARQVITKAIERDVALDPPPMAAPAIGDDRFRQDLFQMIHVSEGRCRVLIRTP